MRRLPPYKRDTAKRLLADTPQNCLPLFLLDHSASVVMVDNEHAPKLLFITYPESPIFNILYGQPDQAIMVKRLLKPLKRFADLVAPQSLFPTISRYWPIKFSIPILLLAASREDWRPEPAQDFRVRLLTPEDAKRVEEAFSINDWLWDFFSSPEELLTQGQAAAAIIDGQMASIATTLAFTENYCELGVATRPEFQGRGFALECARALSKSQFETFGRLPVWRTSAGNIGSLKTAQRLGLTEIRDSEEFLFLSNYEHVGVYATVAP